MSSQVAVLIIHGMGSQKSDFAEATMDEINRRISSKGKDPAKVNWKPVFWADVIEPRQTKFMQDIVKHKDNDIDFIKLRRFVITAMGDAAAYQSIRGKKSSTYSEIHTLVKACVKDLFKNQLGKQACPLIVMAHSLGGHIMSNYIWDIQQKPNQRLSDFENMQYLAGMVTFGCNIPLFTFSHTKLEPFSFPGPRLSATEKSKAQWLNFYDADDVLGYPLRQLSDSYKKLVNDRPINSGGLLTSWNPLSHNEYWTDNDMTKPVAELIAQFI